MFVKEIMSQPVITASVDENLDAVARKMWENDFGSVPVVDKQGRLAGIVTDRDVCMAAYTQGKPLTAIPVKGVMAKEVFSSHPEDAISEAEKVMSTRQVRRVPVINAKGEVVGIVSLNDLARRTVGSEGTLKRDIAPVDVLRTMVAVGKPRPHKVPQG